MTENLERRELWIPIGKKATTGQGEEEYQGILSSDALDRDKEEISKELLKEWAKAKYLPILLDHRNLVMNNVGEWTNKKLIEHKGHAALLVEPKFFMSNPNSYVVRGMLKDGAKLGLSVGFLPQEHEEVKRNGETIIRYTKGELLEGSFTPIPSNKLSYMQVAKSFGIESTKKIDKTLEVKNMPEKTNEELQKEVEELTTKLSAQEAKNAELQKKGEGGDDPKGDPKGDPAPSTEEKVKALMEEHAKKHEAEIQKLREEQEAKVKAMTDELVEVNKKLDTPIRKAHLENLGGAPPKEDSNAFQKMVSHSLGIKAVE